VCAYQFLTGRLPHEYSSLTELALKQQREAVVPIAEFRPDVPPELDRAIRVSLEREPTDRYASALAMAAALEAGARGEETGPTQAFSTTGTRILGADDADATQALPATRAPRRAPRTPGEPMPEPLPARRERAPQRKKSGAARARLVALALILVLAAVAIAILVSGTSGSGFTDINASSPRDQATQLIQYVRAHQR
jgi:hypothetical protein